jgi:2-polyprenyl-3-methyl-5-hydroxy-6-metoxy-1,4-benzoquinol methylase
MASVPAPVPAASEPVDFSRRATAPELMDDDALSLETYADVISGLALVNTLTLTHRPTLLWLAEATRGLDRFSLVDVGFGHGDMLRAIAEWARKRGKTAELTGVDLNPRSAPVAEAATDPAFGIRWLTGDAADLAGTPDFIISSLVTHHMDDAGVVWFLGWMETAAVRGWFINDLHRSWIAWAGFKVIAFVLRLHPIVQHDGALSIRRSFTRADWRRLFAEANLAEPPVSVRWRFPFRWAVGRLK